MSVVSLQPKVVNKLSESLDGFTTEAGFISTPDGNLWIGLGPVTLSARPQPGLLSIYAPDFFLKNEKPWRIYETSLKLSLESVIEALEPLAEDPEPIKWQPSSYQSFETDFEEIQDLIQQGKLIKAVPFITRKAPVRFSKANRAAILLRALRRCQGQPLRAYGFWDDAEGLLGTTPELLFSENGSLKTMALAGTRPLGAPSLLNDPKEVTEHQIVVEAIVERLSPLGEVKTGPTAELELPTLAHLYTPIEVIPNTTVAFHEWVAALHPTPAIGAWPLGEGWNWLERQPNARERGRYGAPFGYILPTDESSNDHGVCLVGIRNVQWNSSEAKILAGCGIIGASQVEREWRELNSKLDSIQGALGL